MSIKTTIVRAAGCGLVLAIFVGTASAQSTTLYVQNNTDGYLTVNVDGVYGCNTSAGSTCSIPVSVGDHNLDATRQDTGAWTSRSQYISSDGYTWAPW